MTDYVWQLGVDWNAIETAGVSYLRGGLVKKGSGGVSDVLTSSTAPVSIGDIVNFQIFDINSSALDSGRKVDRIGSFVILSQAAVKDQVIGTGLSFLQPAFTQDEEAAVSATFGASWRSWTSQLPPLPPVAVAPEGAPSRFLLTIQVQAIGTDNRVRLFSHDPEMVVGPFE